MKVVFFDPHLESGVDLSTGYDRVHALEDLMARSDIVSVHAPLTDERRDCLGIRHFPLPSPALSSSTRHAAQSSILMRLSRRCATDRVAGAGIDVLPSEPQDMKHPLLAAWRRREAWIADRLVVTPHAAFYSPAAMQDLRLKSVEVVRALLTEGRLTNCVNRQASGESAHECAAAPSGISLCAAPGTSTRHRA